MVPIMAIVAELDPATGLALVIEISTATPEVSLPL
jgi:hypothetical protein